MRVPDRKVRATSGRGAEMAARRAVMNRGFPLSDHCDGRVFFNPGPGEQPALSSVGGHGPPRGLRQLLRWRFLGEQRAAWPARVSDPVFAPPPDSVVPGSIAITFINQASFLLRLPGTTVLTDPIFSERCSPVSWAGPKRVREPGISLADLPRPDVVLVSHNHYDHMDFPTLRALQARFAPLFVTTLGNARTLARLGIVATELDWWQDVTVGALRITATPARHFSARTPFDRNRTLWGGFMVRTGAGTVLFAGDSGAGPHWGDIRARLGAPDVALLPIGAYEPRWFMAPVHMNPAEAVEAHLALGARRSVGMHFGTFQLTDEAIDAPLLALEAARQALGVDAFGTLGFGETGVYELAGGSAGSGGALGSPGLGCGGMR
jgi:L-ascorbate metabolism protein UlaG (beta-lactamase superfamily)